MLIIISWQHYFQLEFYNIEAEWDSSYFDVMDIIWNVDSNSGHKINILLRWSIDQFLIECRPWMLLHIPFRLS